MKQEQQPASDQILEIAPGVLRTQLPISIPGLGHVNMYVLEDERGVAVVDPGLPDKNSFAMVRKRLDQVGVPLKNVHTVIVTHSHPDHFGGAYWLRAETGCDIVTHERFRVFWDPSEPDDVDLDDPTAVDEMSDRPPVRRPWDPPPWGGPSMEVIGRAHV